jgi:hypothetical protein
MTSEDLSVSLGFLINPENDFTYHSITGQGNGKDSKKRFIHFPSYPGKEKNPFMQNMSQFSDYPVGFRQVTYDLMFALEYLFYYLHPYGINVLSDPLKSEFN